MIITLLMFYSRSIPVGVLFFFSIVLQYNLCNFPCTDRLKPGPQMMIFIPTTNLKTFHCFPLFFSSSISFISFLTEYSPAFRSRQQIMAALNAQTAVQFQQYAAQQYPNSPEQQLGLIRQLQEQHYQQYMQQLYQVQLAQQQVVCSLNTEFFLAFAFCGSLATFSSKDPQNIENSLN